MIRYDEQFQMVLDFLNLYKSLIDCHLVDFITDELWDNCLSEPLRVELENMEASANVFTYNKENINLNNFMNTIKSLSLESYSNVINLQDLPELLSNTVNDDWKVNIDCVDNKLKFMNKKKFHEVEVLGNVIKQLANAINGLVIDAGAGKAYLSTYLSENFNISVLAIDSSNLRQESAIQRQEKIKRKGNVSPTLMKYVVERISDKTDYCNIVKLNFPDWNLKNNLILTGLHTCGSLMHSLIRVFLQTKEIKMFCVVPCCYHLANESLNKEINFSKNARMLAQQSIERINKNKLLPPILFYRAVLQVLLRSMGLCNAKVGRSKYSDNFPTYARWALLKIGLDVEKIPSAENLQELYKSHLNLKRKFDTFQMLRIYLSPVVETAILLDRIVYLQNSKQCSKVAILRLFDPVLSPRRHGIIAIK